MILQRNMLVRRDYIARVLRQFAIRTNFRSEAKRAVPIIRTIGSSVGVIVPWENSGGTLERTETEEREKCSSKAEKKKNITDIYVHVKTFYLFKIFTKILDCWKNNLFKIKSLEMLILKIKR